MPIRHPLVRILAATLLGLATSLAQAAEITVSAAASLTNAFREIAGAYEAARPGVRVRLNFGASGALLQQIAKGAPVDVFASADQETMDAAGRQALLVAGTRRDFARNTLVLVTPVDSRQGLRRLEDLGQPTVRRIAIGNPASVPVGRYARHALDRAGLWDSLRDKVIGTQNVRQSLDYVARGEVDAGFVYATDAALMKDRVAVAFTVRTESPVLYPIAVTTGGGNQDEARRFVDFVTSPVGQAALGRQGFLQP
jgi:molybdate transport system substrate-binding protein